MSNNIGDIIAKKNIPHEPIEFPLIRQFVQDRIHETPKLQMREKSIVISVPSSAAAGSLRLQIHELIDELNTDKQLIIASV